MGLFGALPMDRLIKQFLMGAGVRDPKVLAMVDTLTEGGFDSPVIEPVEGSRFDIPTGASAVRVSVRRPGEELSLILISKKSIDIAQTLMHPDPELEVAEGRLLKP